MRNVLHVLEVTRLVYELVLEEHDVALMVLRLALVATCFLTLVAGKYDFLIFVNWTIRFGGI